MKATKLILRTHTLSKPDLATIHGKPGTILSTKSGSYLPTSSNAKVSEPAQSCQQRRSALDRVQQNILAAVQGIGARKSQCKQSQPSKKIVECFDLTSENLVSKRAGGHIERFDAIQRDANQLCNVNDGEVCTDMFGKSLPKSKAAVQCSAKASINRRTIRKKPPKIQTARIRGSRNVKSIVKRKTFSKAVPSTLIQQFLTKQAAEFQATKLGKEEFKGKRD